MSIIMYTHHLTVRKKRIQINPTELLGRLFSRKGGNRTEVPRQSDISLLNYMVTTSLPYLDVESGIAQNRICCSGCRISFRKSTDITSLTSFWALEDKEYSHDEFKEHFHACEGAQKLWELRNKGFNVPSVSPRLDSFSCTTGYLPMGTACNELLGRSYCRGSKWYYFCLMLQDLLITLNRLLWSLFMMRIIRQHARSSRI